jgi:hypothetical protein
MRLSRAGLTAAGGLTAMLVTAVVAGPAPKAGAALAYTASAAATGVRISETVPGSPATDTLVDGGAAVAQALLATGGNSTGFASNPYPGATAAAFPSQLRGLAPQLPAIPDYPFYVAASYPTNPNPDAVASPGGVLTATAGPAEVTARAASGGMATGTALGRLEARTRVSGGDDSVRSEATSIAQNIVLGPLTIGSVVSAATVTLAADGQLARHSSLEVTGMDVNGKALTISNGAIVLAGTDVPLPEAGPLADALAQAGLEIGYAAPRQTDNGLISEALVVRRIQDTPNGQARIVLSFGEAVAAIDGTVLPDTSGLAGDPGAPDAGTLPAESLTAVPSSVEATASAAAGEATPSLAAVLGNGDSGPAETFSLGGAPAAASGAAPQVVAPPAPIAPPVRLATPAAALFWRFDLESSYLALAAGTLIAAGAHLVTGGVKRRWNS